MDVQYFIDKFEAIPEEKWCVGTFRDTDGRSCANGHLGVEVKGVKLIGDGLYYQYTLTEESLAINDLVANLSVTTNSGEPYVDEFIDINAGYSNLLASINNGNIKEYQQETPKQRVLAALRDIQSKEREAKGAQTLALVKWEPEEGEWGPENEEKGNPFEEESAGPYAPGAFSMRWEPEDDELEDEEVEIEAEVPSEC